jgi:hypothetical protein
MKIWLLLTRRRDIEILDSEDDSEAAVLYVVEAQDRKDREP